MKKFIEEEKDIKLKTFLSKYKWHHESTKDFTFCDLNMILHLKIFKVMTEHTVTQSYTVSIDYPLSTFDFI